MIKAQGSFEQLSEKSEEFHALVSEQQKVLNGADENKGDTNGNEDINDENLSSNDRGEAKTVAKDAVSTDKINSGTDVGNKQGKAGEKLMQDEERRTGEVGYQAYMSYARQMTHPVLFITLLLYFIISTALSFIVLWWLTYWAEQKENAAAAIADDPTADTDEHSEGFYLGIYVAIIALYTITTFTRSVWLLSRALKASKNNRMLASVLHEPLTFFDTTPIGRIIARFSHDMSALDEKLPQYLNQTLNTVIPLVLTYVFIGIFYHPL